MARIIYPIIATGKGEFRAMEAAGIGVQLFELCAAFAAFVAVELFSVVFSRYAVAGLNEAVVLVVVFEYDYGFVVLGF